MYDDDNNDDLRALIEVERASALLHDRDPDQAEDVIRAAQAAEAERDARQQHAAQVHVAAVKRRRNRNRKILVIGGAAVVLAVAAVPVVRAIMQEAERANTLRNSLEALSKPVMRVGLNHQRDWLDVPPAGVVFEVPRNTCTALVGVTEGDTKPQKLHLERSKIDRFDTVGGAVWCSCDAEEVRVTFPATGQRRTALRMLGTPMSGTGGIEVLASSPIEGFLAHVDGPALGCADHAFQSWAKGSTNGALTPLGKEEKGLAAALLNDGAKPVGRFAGDALFGVIHSEPGNCYLAVPTTPSIELTLRSEEGRLAKDTSSAIGWCAYGSAGTYSLWRRERPTADVIVVVAVADKLGGLAGLRELAGRHGSKQMLGFVNPDDLTRDAVAMLKATSVPEPSLVEASRAGLPGKSGNTVAAFSLLPNGSYLGEVAPTVPLACQPRREAQEVVKGYVCLQSRAQLWRAEGAEKKQGAAEAQPPFWMSLLGGSEDKQLLEAAAGLMAFSRRMTLLGFEPTTTDGVRDDASGATITGRPGRAETVAVGLSRQAPYVQPLTDGPAWKLDGELRILQVPPDKVVRLKAARSLGADPTNRRGVVWRR